MATCAENVRLWNCKEQILQFESRQHSASCSLLCEYAEYDDILITGYHDAYITVNHLLSLNKGDNKMLKNSISLKHDQPVAFLSFYRSTILAVCSNRIDCVVYSKDHGEQSDIVEHLIQFPSEVSIVSYDSTLDAQSKLMMALTTSAGRINVYSYPNIPVLSDFRPTQLIEEEYVEHDLLVRFGTEDFIVFTGHFKQPRIIFYDYKRRHHVRSFLMNYFARCMDVSPNMSHVAFGTTGRLVVLLDSEQGTNASYPAHRDSVECVKFHQDQSGELLLYSGGDGELCSWTVTHIQDK
ncbi:hypothetical protein AKO1_004549, partial [Acrasis kona]